MQIRVLYPFFLFFLLTTSYFHCQTEKEPTLGGVYLTLDDYKSGKLTYDIDCSLEKQKIKLHDFLAKPYMDVYYRGEKHRLLKNEVYGFKDCHDQTFRFFDNLEYKLVEAGNIYLYTLEQLIFPEKADKTTVDFFFSSSMGGVIKPLNNINLKNAFPTNKTFHRLLDESINSINITRYDSIHKMYTVNKLYLESLAK
jgi:hypothetical protein